MNWHYFINCHLIKHYHKKKVNGVKISKERISVGACDNASGTDKVKLVVIHKYQKPRSFGKTWTPYHLVDHYWNQKAWMTQLIMSNWLEKFNNKMKLFNRHVLLFLDNASGHGTFEKFFFSNVTIEYLPPMDAGVIRNLKLHYKKLLVNLLLQKLNEKKKI